MRYYLNNKIQQEDPSDLYNCVQEGHRIKHGLPLHHVGYVKDVLCDSSIGTLQTSLYTLRRFIGKLDGCLKNEKYIGCV